MCHHFKQMEPKMGTIQATVVANREQVKANAAGIENLTKLVNTAIVEKLEMMKKEDERRNTAIMNEFSVLKKQVKEVVHRLDAMKQER